MRFKRRHAPEPHVPFIALADIAWQLIIFFLVTSSFIKNDALNIELPNSDPERQQEQEADTITVQADEKSVLLNDAAVELRDLESAIAALVAGKTADHERVVVMVAHPDLTFQRDVEIKLAIKRAGGIVAMLADEEEGGE